MEPINLSNLSPASVDPRELVDRDGDAEWLHNGLTAWFRASDPRVGGAFCVLGDKGIGKSILVRRVIENLRELHAATAVFVTVDCRPLRTQRDVYREAATQLVDDLSGRRDVIAPLLSCWAARTTPKSCASAGVFDSKIVTPPHSESSTN